MAPERALFIAWNRPIAGREEQAMRLFETALGYCDSLVSEGKLDSFEPGLLEHHRGDLNGFTLLRGTKDQVQEVRNADRFIDIVAEAHYCLEGVGVLECAIGTGMQEFLQRWAKLIAQQ